MTVTVVSKPQRSQISFPYRDQASAISVAQHILEGGGVPHSSDQLAGRMGLQPGSGNFVVRVAAARIFGLIAHTSGKYELTDLGFAITDRDEKRKRQAMAQSFLGVPLYKRVYDDFRGKQLPPRPLGLEQAFVKFGVSPKQATAARQIFDKSAEQAGFFNHGDDRLIEPVGVFAPVTAEPLSEVSELEATEKSSQRPQNNLGGLHPFIQGLLEVLPVPGSEWDVGARADWLEAAEKIFDLIYKGPKGEIVFEVKRHTGA